MAPNPGPFTGPGTGTYIIGRGEVAVIDPGPMLPDHVDALLAGLRGETVSHILVTHTHADHSPAARLLARRTGAPVFAFGPHAAESAGELEGGVDRDFAPDFPLGDGEAVRGDGWTLEALHTPGHCSNHLCFAWPEAGALFCGDQVMAWATPVIIPPDGSVGDYLESLDRLMLRPERVFYPTHGTPAARPRVTSSPRSGRTGCIAWRRRLRPLTTVWAPCPPCAAGSTRMFPGTSMPARNCPCSPPSCICEQRGRVLALGEGPHRRYVPA